MLLSSQLRKINEISPRMKEIPTMTFQLSRYVGLGLNFEIIAPDIRKPDVIDKIAVGPENKLCLNIKKPVCLK